MTKHKNMLFIYIRPSEHGGDNKKKLLVYSNLAPFLALEW